MKKIAVFPGSFSPFTYGHLSIIERMLPLFDKIVVAVGVNSLKNNSYPTSCCTWIYPYCIYLKKNPNLI